MINNYDLFFCVANNWKYSEKFNKLSMIYDATRNFFLSRCGFLSLKKIPKNLYLAKIDEEIIKMGSRGGAAVSVEA